MFSHQGKWINFDDYMDLGFFYCFLWPVTIYFTITDNGYLQKLPLKIIGFVLMFIVLSIWIYTFIWLPLTILLFVIQILSEANN